VENEKPLIWLHGEVKTPPFTSAAGIESGLLLRRLQKGDSLGIPHSKPKMPDEVSERCRKRLKQYDSKS